MKIIIVFVSLSLLTDSTMAQQLIALHHSGQALFYTDFVTAVNAAQSGDTVYVPGFSYSNTAVSINKEIHIIGVGHDPDSTLATSFTYLNGSINFTAGSDYSTIEGVRINGGIFFGSYTGENAPVNSITIRRCYMITCDFMQYYDQNYQYHPNESQYILFENNIISGFVNGGYSHNNGFYNNIILGAMFYFSDNNIFRNNIFYSQGSCYYWTSSCAMSAITNCMFENNIFLSAQQIPYGITGGLFNNNIFVQGMPTGAIGSNNLINQPQFEIFTMYSNSLDVYSEDYHLNALSVGNSAGTDGTDIGIYGGAFPWKEGSVPANPHIQTKNLGYSTDQNGNFPINIKVAAQDQ
ncbi:MAG: hypothetical protein IPG01_09245 [Chitinophagaceae bacterium]|nr:hypothetical protein [Chitinophagaceae bacterium]